MVSGFILGIRVRALGLRVRLVDLNFGVSTGLGLRVFEQHGCLLLSYLGRPNGVLSNNSLFWGEMGVFKGLRRLAFRRGLGQLHRYIKALGGGLTCFGSLNGIAVHSWFFLQSVTYSSPRLGIPRRTPI